MTEADASPLPAERLGELREAYRGFLRQERVLLTGHSHQAWPDVARQAQLDAFELAATHVDDKWPAILEIMNEVAQGVLGRMGFGAGDQVAFGQNTHELVYRLLSCFFAGGRTRIVTTTSEFHSMHRQLSRLAEEGVEVVWVDAQPREALVDRLHEALRPGASLLALSAVFFEDAFVVDGLADILVEARARGATVLVDAYHAFNVVPIDWGPAQAAIYATAGGYKYAGFGDGICWLRIPAGCELRPAFTGWFADFASLERPREVHQRVTYAAGGARFAGATFDASALLRARAVLRHWQRFGLDVPALRAISIRQTRRIVEQLDAARCGELASSRRDERRGGFVALRQARAAEIAKRARARGVFVDARGDLLRLGPAPYLTDEEIDRGVEVVITLSREVAG